MQSAYKLATLGGGCFWCLDGVFTRVKGVIKVESGFSGDVPANANYKQVCSGTTKHAEVVQIQFDELVVTFVELLTIFFGVHDPTTLNKYRFLYNYRQGHDVGPQYRSVIFYHDEEQRIQAQTVIQQLTEGKVFGKPIVTEVSAYPGFYVAEDYHQNYYNLNPNEGYCRGVIDPKVKKFMQKFADRLKPEYKL